MQSEQLRTIIYLSVFASNSYKLEGIISNFLEKVAHKKDVFDETLDVKKIWFEGKQYATLNDQKILNYMMGLGFQNLEELIECIDNPEKYFYNKNFMYSAMEHIIHFNDNIEEVIESRLNIVEKAQQMVSFQYAERLAFVGIKAYSYSNCVMGLRCACRLKWINPIQLMSFLEKMIFNIFADFPENDLFFLSAKVGKYYHLLSEKSFRDKKNINQYLNDEINMWNNFHQKNVAHLEWF